MVEWIERMKRAIDETYPSQKWRDRFHSIVDRMVEAGNSEGETARRVWLHIKFVHWLYPDIPFNTVEDRKEAEWNDG